jgi:hypothetical protein
MDIHYGSYLFYPVCEKAKIFADLLGTKTLSYRAMEGIKKLGYQIECKDLSVKL